LASAVTFIVLCLVAGFIVAMLRDKRKGLREKAMSDVPRFDDLHADALQRAEAGDAAAWADLGYSYLHGLGCEYDSEKALECYRKGAELHDMKACYGIYEMNSNGVSLVPDDEAKAMLERAAELGHEKAAFILRGGD